MAIITRFEKQNKKKRDSLLTGPAGPWHRRAPRRIRQSYQSPADERNWSDWRKHIAKREFRPLNELLPGKRPALLWALPDGVNLDQTLELIETLRKVDRSEKQTIAALENDVACWLAQIESASPTVELGLESLAWCGSLPALTAHLPPQLWWLLVNRLIAITRDGSTASADPLPAQLLFGELPLALAYTLPELETSDQLVSGGRNVIAESIAELLDGEGLPHGRHLPLLRPLLACWTRTQAIARQLSGGWGGKKAKRQFARLAENALRLSRADGRAVFAPSGSPPWDPSLLKAAIRLADDRDTERAYRFYSKDGPAKTLKKPTSDAAFQGEWAGLALLRPSWNSKSPHLTVSYDKPLLTTELSVDGAQLWSGSWSLDVRLNDVPLKPLGNWEQTCWISDDDVDYLELEMELSEEVSVQRHIVLGRKDRFVFLADAILGIQDSSIAYRGALSLSDAVSFRDERETREGSLVVDSRPLARVLPLALNEWRSGATCGNFQTSGASLELSQKAQGECLFAPLFIDLDRRRSDKEVTWRQLTVAQNRQIVPNDVAVGYRVQIGKAQWLIYRSLAPQDVRTVLGRNLMTEFLVGRFKTDGGGVEPLLEIE